MAHSRLLLLCFLALSCLIQTAWSRGPKKRTAKEPTEEEQLMAFWPAFKAFDQNKDAFITADEITSALNSMQDEFKGDEIEDMIRALSSADIDGDRGIKFPEFAKMFSDNLSDEL